MFDRSQSQTAGRGLLLPRVAGVLCCRLAFFIILFAIALGDLLALQVTPALHYFTLKPGEKTKGSYMVRNETEEEVLVTPETKEWFVLPENKEQGFTIEKWLSVKSTSFVLKPGESKQVHFQVNVPKGAVGELMGMVSYLMEGEEKVIKKRFSLAVYVGIAGSEKPASEIPAVMVDVSSSTLMAGFIFHNTGNVHLRPEAMMEISNEKGTPVANVSIRRTSPTYPGQKIPYSGSINNFTLPPGQYSARITGEDVDRGVPIPETIKKFTVTKDKKVIAK